MPEDTAMEQQADTSLVVKPEDEANNLNNPPQTNGDHSKNATQTNGEKDATLSEIEMLEKQVEQSAQNFIRR
jgi:hypothetical protein